MKKRHFICFLAIFSIFLLSGAQPAYAIIIKNNDTVTHKLIVKVAGSAPEIIKIKPKSMHRHIAPETEIQLIRGDTPGRALHGEMNDLYMIWKGGDIGIQKRRDQKRWSE